jgi:hypothetical protein
MTLSITTLNMVTHGIKNLLATLGIATLCHYAECQILFVVVLNVVMLSIMMLNAIILSVFMLNVVILSVIILNEVMVSVCR